MGRAKIASGGADGLYTVTVDYGKAERDAWAARLTTAIAALNPVIEQAQAAYLAAEQEKVDAQAAVDAAINVWAAAQQANPAQDHKALAKAAQEAVEAVVRAEGRLAPLRMALEESRARKAGLQLELNALMAAQVEATLAGVWCVDLTEDAAVGADVGTVEVPGEPQSVLLVPGCTAPGPANGALAARELMSPEQVFFNAAILPGWQKFYPTYRKGTLTAVDVEADTATVELDAAVSSAQNLPVNQGAVLTGVPVEYMTCNAAVFEPGDRVVVQFLGQNWDAPKVIGFAQWPRACLNFEIFAAVSQSVQGWRKRPLGSGISEAEFLALALAGQLRVFISRSCGPTVELTYIPARPGNSTYPGGMWGTNSTIGGLIVQVLQYWWRPDYTGVIVFSPASGVNSGRIQTLDGRDVLRWGFYYFGGSSFAMSPLLLTPPGDLPFVPSQNVVLWDKTMYPDCGG